MVIGPFKRESISKLKQEKEIFYFYDNFNEVLSLSHILWLEVETYSNPLVRIFGKDNLRVLSKTVKNYFKKPEKLPHDLITTLYDIFEEHEEDYVSIDNELFELRKHHETRSVIMILILFKFYVKEKFKFRSTEKSLPERKLRTQNIKRPDFMVSSVNINEFTFTRMIGEVKIGTYDQDSLQTVYDKYKLALFGKDCLDDDTEFVILSQTVGNDVRFYLMTVLDEAFYISVYLKSICLPLSVLDLKSFVNELNDIFSIRNLVSSISKVERNEKWKRETLQTPIFEDYIPVNVNHRPTKKGKKKRQQNEDYDDDKGIK